jgi:DNA-binding protein
VTLDGGLNWILDLLTTLTHDLQLHLIKGRAIAQAVSRRLPTAAVRNRVVMWDFVVDKVEPGQVFSEYFGFPCQI